MLEACILDFAELLLLGHRLWMIVKAWHASQSQDPGYMVGMKALRLLKHMKHRNIDKVELPQNIRQGLEAIYGITI